MPETEGAPLLARRSPGPRRHRARPPTTANPRGARRSRRVAESARPRWPSTRRRRPRRPTRVRGGRARADRRRRIDDGPVHRPLIRAQLPRDRRHKEERRLPEFTIRQAGSGGERQLPRRRRTDEAASPWRRQQWLRGGNGNRSHGGPALRRSASGRGPGGGNQGGRGGPAAGFRGADQPASGRAEALAVTVRPGQTGPSWPEPALAHRARSRMP